jgi:uncharacterized membrane protein
MKGQMIIMLSIFIGFAIAFIGFYLFTRSAFNFTHFGAMISAAVFSSLSLVMLLLYYFGR